MKRNQTLQWNIDFSHFVVLNSKNIICLELFAAKFILLLAITNKIQQF